MGFCFVFLMVSMVSFVPEDVKTKWSDTFIFFYGGTLSYSAGDEWRRGITQGAWPKGTDAVGV